MQRKKYKESLSAESRVYLDRIEKLEMRLSQFESLFLHNCLTFFNLDYPHYATFSLLHYMYPESEDIKFYVNSLLDEILSNLLKDKSNDHLILIKKVAKKSLPSIEQIVDEVNIKISHQPIGICSQKFIRPVNKKLILKYYIYILEILDMKVLMLGI